MEARDGGTPEKLRLVRQALGEPTLEFDSALIYEGDCLEYLRRLPAGLVDLTVTSPPYNIGKAYEAVRPLAEYLGWCGEWMGEVFRITAPAGAFWLNVGYVPVPGRAKALPLSYLIWDRSPFHLVQEVVWHYGAGVATRSMFCPRNEKYLWFARSLDRYTFNLDEVRDPEVSYPRQKKHGKLRCNPLGKNPGDVWAIPKVTTGEGMTGRRASPERTPHPAQFPEAVIDRIVRACSNPGDLVMDPFLGSGTTAAVALGSGRSVVGFEIKAEYVEIVGRRLGRRAAAGPDDARAT